MSQPYITVDVILTTFNGEHYLKEQIDSVLGQQNVSVRVWAFDDASSDGTRDVILGYASKGAPVSLMARTCPSGGAFESYRQALLDFQPSAAYIAFCDQDDIWRTDKLSLQLNALEINGAVGCSSSVKAFQQSELDSRVVNNVGRQTGFDYFFEGGGQGCTYLFRADLLAGLQLALRLNTGPALPHDWLLYAMVRMQNLHWVILQEPLVEYRQHASNAFGARGSMAGRLRRLQMLGEGHFRKRREALCKLLSRLPHGDSVPSVFLGSASFSKRLAFAFTHAFSLRRFKLHSLVIAVFFAVGQA